MMVDTPMRVAIGEGWSRLRRQSPGVLAAILATALLVGSGVAAAAGGLTEPWQPRRFPVGQIFTFLFLMLGPFKIIGPFSKITRGADAATANRIALQAIVFSSVALTVAVLLGESFLDSYGIPLPVLALSAGIILFLVALLHILQQFMPQALPEVQDSGPTPTPTLKEAMAPLAFPTIVTPYGIAALVVFVAISPDLQGRLTIGAILLVIMLLNLLVMVMTRYILPVLSVVLPILGAVLGVVQVALGLQIIHSSSKALGLL